MGVSQMDESFSVTSLSIRHILTSQDSRLNAAANIARYIRKLGLPDDLYDIPVKEAYNIAQQRYRPPAGTEVEFDILLALVDILIVLKDAEERYRKDMEQKESMRRERESMQRERESFEKLEKALQQRDDALRELARVQAQIAEADAKYEKAQMLRLRYRGICDGCSMPDVI